MSGMIRKHILFYGRVQGVGFRYHATYKASLLGLTGWVRNLEPNVAAPNPIEQAIVGDNIFHQPDVTTGL